MPFLQNLDSRLNGSSIPAKSELNMIFQISWNFRQNAISYLPSMIYFIYAVNTAGIHIDIVTSGDVTRGGWEGVKLKNKKNLLPPFNPPV